MKIKITFDLEEPETLTKEEIYDSFLAVIDALADAVNSYKKEQEEKA